MMNLMVSLTKEEIPLFDNEVHTCLKVESC